MCSATNYVLPLRRTSEVLNPPGRLLRGGSMSTNLPGARPHGPLQETDIDLAWQELMAITELQEFEVPSEGPFETLQYHPMDPVGGYGLAQSHSDPLATAAACELIPTAAYEGTYTDVGPACNRLCTSAEGLYARSGPQLTPKMLPATLNLQPTLMGVMEHMHMAGTSEEHRKTGSSCLSQGPGRYMLRTVNGQALRAHVTDDLESDSGLSLGSSPPLASPDNGMSAVLGYQNTELSLNFSDGEIDGLSEQARRAQIQYTMDYQNQHQPYLYSAHSSYYPTQPDLTRIQHNPIPPVPVTQLTGLASASNDLHVSSSSLPSRGSSNQGLCMKPQGNTSAPAPMSRDERRALALKIPFSIDRIINLPVDDFNELLTQYTLNDSQLALVRDIRRRGKNKVAAQNCRKRKMENIVHLEGELGQLQAQRDHLARERLEFQRSLAFVKCRLTDLYTEVFSHLRDEDGHPYSINDYYLQQTPDGKIYLVPRTTTQGREC